MESTFNGMHNQNSNKTKEGKVTIDPPPIKKPKNNKTVGEYVDYEEID